jgi:peptidyl-tRNA hydrolase
MRRGKDIAQGSHASMMWLRERLVRWPDEHVDLNLPEQTWLNGEYRKVVLQVDSEAELVALRDAADREGLEAYLVTDMGATEFHGVPTITALAIGPAWSDRVDLVTKHLKLY